MPRNETALTLDPSILRRKPVQTDVQPTDRKLSLKNERIAHLARKVWERHVVRAVGKLVPGGNDNRIEMFSKFEEFSNGTSGDNGVKTEDFPQIRGLFLDNPVNNRTATDLLKLYQSNNPDKHVYVIPAGLPLIDSGFHKFDGLERENTEFQIINKYLKENRPAIHEAGVGKKDPKQVARTISEHVHSVGTDSYKTLRNAVLQGAPIFSDRTTDRLLVVSAEQLIPELKEVSLSVENYLQLRPNDAPTTNIIYIEGAQASSKTTQVKALRAGLETMGIFVADPLPFGEDPMLILKEDEEHEGKMMPFGVRQAVVRTSLKERSRHSNAQAGTVGVGDRSPNSAAMTSITTRGITEGTSREHGADIKVTEHWLTTNRDLFNGLSIVLEMDDIYRSFFRMRQDPSTDNQQNTLTTQFLEHVFYDTLARQGRGVKIGVQDKVPGTITEEILARPEVGQVIKNVEMRRNTRNAIKEWWGAEDRVGVWFSTRLMKEQPDDQVIEEASKLLAKNPDMIYVGAAKNITREDQERVINLCKKARETMGLHAKDVKIVDFPSNPEFIAGNGDFAVIMRALNTSNTAVDQDRVRNALELLVDRNTPYVIGGYVLFDNGSNVRPSVADTLNVSSPLNNVTGAKQHVLVSSAAADVLYFDRGSNPPSGPLSIGTVEKLVEYTELLPENHRPVVVVGGGVETLEQAKDLLDIKGVRTVVYEEEPTETDNLHPNTLPTN